MRIAFCLLFFIYFLFPLIQAGVPPPNLGTCVAANGILRSFDLNVTTFAGFSSIHDLGLKASSIGFYSFNLTARCIGYSYLPGLSPLVVYLRKDGTPWDLENSFKMEIYEQNSFALFEGPSYTPFVASFVGYEGFCLASLVVQYCECNAGKYGENCAYSKTPFNTLVPSNSGQWNYHCIQQGGGAHIIARNYTVGLSVPAGNSSDLWITGRWGAPPGFIDFSDEARLYPPATSVSLVVHSPRYESGVYPDAETCFWIGVLNASPNNISYTLNYTSNVCTDAHGPHCEYAIQHANFSEPLVGVIGNDTWFLATYNPSKIPTQRPLFYDFFLTTNESSVTFYVRRDAPPTHLLYDYINNSTNTVRVIRVPFPAYGPQQNTKWWVGVYRVGGEAQLYFNLDAIPVYCDRCIPGQGECFNRNETYPRCVCNANYAGRDCDSPVNVLFEFYPWTAPVAANHETYHQFRVPELSPYRSVLNFRIETLEGGPVQFLLQNSTLPTSYNHYAQSMHPNVTFAITRPTLIQDNVWYLTATNFGTTDAIYRIFTVIDIEIPAPPPTPSSTGFTTTGVRPTQPPPNPTPPPNPNNQVVYKNSPGAMAGLAVAMLIAGGAIGAGVLWLVKRRGPLSHYENL